MKTRLKKQQNGTSLLELAITLPVLLILMMGIVDLGKALNHYLRVTRATYEGLRYGAGLYANTPGCVGPECASNTQPTDNLSEMDGRVKKILKMQGYDAALVTIDSSKATTTQSGVQRSFNIIKATVEVPYMTLFPFINKVPIKTTISFTDLYKDDTSNVDAF